MNILVRFCCSALFLVFAFATSGYVQPSKPLSIVTSTREMDGSIRGVVYLAGGKPAANASVWVVAGYIVNSPRSHVFSTQTDAKGMYQITELPHPDRNWESRSVGFAIFAKAEGYPIAKTQLKDTTGKATAPGIPLREPNASVSISIKTATGSPAAHVAVMLIAKEGYFLRLLPVGNPETYNALLEQLRPQALTDADGKVRFSHLLAGKYQVVVTRNKEQLLAINRGDIGFAPPPPENFEQRFDLALPAGNDTATSYRLSNK